MGLECCTWACPRRVQFVLLGPPQLRTFVNAHMQGGIDFEPPAASLPIFLLDHPLQRAGTVLLILILDSP